MHVCGDGDVLVTWWWASSISIGSGVARQLWFAAADIEFPPHEKTARARRLALGTTVENGDMPRRPRAKASFAYLASAQAALWLEPSLSAM